MNMREKYLKEYEKYKDVRRSLGEYKLKSNNSIRYEIVGINETTERAELKNVRSGNMMGKTLHWCRKNLEEVL